MTTVVIECRICGGTGLYHGFAEPKGTAVVCLSCGGTGSEKLSYTPFEKRKDKAGIEFVQASRGAFLATGVGPTGNRITYQEFRKGKMP